MITAEMGININASASTISQSITMMSEFSTGNASSTVPALQVAYQFYAKG